MAAMDVREGNRIYRIIVGTALVLGLLLAIMYLRRQPGPVYAVLPWFVPVISLFQGFVFFAVAFLALGRCSVMGDAASFWIGMGAAGIGVTQGFYALSWPELLPGGSFASLRTTPVWILQLGFSIYGFSLLAAVLLRRPVNREFPGSSLLWSTSVWVALLGILFTFVLFIEQALPPLLNEAGGATAALLLWDAVLALVFGAGACLSTRRFLGTGDVLLGYIAFSQTGYAFVMLAGMGGVRRYDLWWYLLRAILTASAMVVLFGLLGEYVQLFRREREKTGQALRAEEALRRSLAETEANRRILETMMEHIPMGIAIVDAHDGRIRAMSRFGRELTGMGQADERQPVSWALLPPENRAPSDDLDMPLSRATLRGEIVLEEEWILQREDGGTIPILCNAAPIRDAGGRIVGGVVGWQDISQRKRADGERERLIAELERSNRELQQFAYVASHDLQEPLRTITSYVELLELRYRGRLGDDAETYITFIVDGTKHMTTLINDLLAFSRIGSRQKPFRPVAMDAVLRQALAGLGNTIGESRARIESEGLPTLAGDRSQLAQLLQNLIGNAIKFRKKEAVPTVRISCVRRGEDWLFGIHDNGIGIEPRFFGKIFEIYQRLHPRSEYPGTGIGLAICRKIVERHRGRIWVESQPGEGTSFYFSLPVAKGEVLEDEQRERPV